MSRGRLGLAAAAVVVVALGGVGIEAAPAQAAGLCIPILMDCSAPTPSATPTPTAPSDDAGGGSSDGTGTGSGGPGSGSGGSGSGGSDSGSGSGTQTPSSPGSGTDSGSGSDPGDDGAPPSATPAPEWGSPTDDDTLVVTQPAAQLSSSSIEIGGLSGLALVQLPRADGSTATVVRLSADRIAMDDFTLDVRGSATGTSAVTTDARMELRGHVQVYLDSVTAELPGGKHLTLGADTPPPGAELPGTWLRVDLGLVAATADSITHTGSDLRVRAGSDG